VEKKNRLWIFAIAILLAMAIGAALAITRARHLCPIKGSSIEDTRIDDIERGLERGSKGITGTIKESGNTARDIEQRERDSIERYRELEGTARELGDKMGRIGETSDRANGCIEDLEGIVEELQRRSGSENR